MKGDRSTSAPLLRIAWFSAAFFAITSLTIGMTRFGGGLALVWLGSAVAAVMLVNLPRQRWAGGLLAIAGASALATSLFGFGPHMAAPLALVNAFEAWLVARLLLAIRPQRDWLDSVAGLAALIAVGGLIGPGLAAITGGYVATLGAPGPWHQHAAQWWAGHGLGTLIGFPMAYLAANRMRMEAGAPHPGPYRAELAGHLSLIAVISVLALGQSVLPLLFLPIVPLLLASYRCGREGATFGTLIVAAVGMWSFDQPGNLIGSLELTLTQDVLFLQFYLATISLLALPASVALRQHQLLLSELEERKALERLVADHTDDALLNLDQHGRVRYASPASARLSGGEELSGKDLGHFFDPLDEPLVRAALSRAAALPGETQVIERPVLCGDEQLWLQANIRGVAPSGAPGARAGELQGYAVTIRDVTERKRTELEAIEASETDALTGLPNRRALLRLLDRSLAHAAQRPFAFAILDLDHFKRINDSLGHPMGDAALCEVAAVMRRMSGPSRFIARIGGEEFALVSRLGSLERGAKLCERLRAEIAAIELVTPNGEPLRITASIGLALIAERGSAGQALQAADALLYQAKHAGRNRVVSSASQLAPERRAA